MNRRGFLSFIVAAIAGAALDPERLLWRSGAKLISIPSVVIEEPTLDEINIATMRYLRVHQEEIMRIFDITTHILGRLR